MKIYIYLIAGLLLGTSCSENVKVKNEDKEPKKLLTNIFNDSIIQSIYELSDRRDAKNLTVFFNSEQAEYRKHAVLCFANIPDSNNTKDIIPLLVDKNPDVRLSASWALAQNSISCLDSTFITALKNESDPNVRNGLWEGLGKKIGNQGLDYFETNDPSKEEIMGYAAGIFAGRRLTATSTVCIDKALSLLNSTEDLDAQLYLSQFVSRIPADTMTSRVDIVLGLLSNKNDEDVDKNLIYSIMGVKDPKIASYLNSSLMNNSRANEKAPLKTVALLNAFEKQFDRPSYQVLQQYLVSKNENIGLAATKGLEYTNFEPKGPQNLLNDPILDQMLPSVRAQFIRMCIFVSNEIPYINDAKEKALKHSDSTIKGYYMKALVPDKTSADFLISLYRKETTLPAKTDCLAALLEMEENGYPEDFDFKTIVDVVVQSKDAGSVAMLCDHVRRSGKEYSKAFPDLSVLENLKMNFSSPEDYEALVELKKTIAFLKGEEYKDKGPKYNHPIEWEHVKGIHPKQVVKVNTDQGSFKIQLDVESAPGSVSTIVKLIEKNFYNNKTFHRVVPNFVIQTGCPRGDGYGSINFSIRSEFQNHRYTAGAVGLASLGPDTESCQWFVTHASVSSLEGRYTIFGYVIEGMDVVQKIQKGAIIENIILLPTY